MGEELIKLQQASDKRGQDPIHLGPKGRVHGWLFCGLSMGGEVGTHCKKGISNS